MANRLDFDKLRGLITNVEYTTVGRQIMCQLTIYNGYHEAGVAGVVDMVNFDEVLGREAAYKKALDNLASLGTFFIRDRMLAEEVLKTAGFSPEDGPLTRFVGYVPLQHRDFLHKNFGLLLSPFPDVSK